MRESIRKLALTAGILAAAGLAGCAAGIEKTGAESGAAALAADESLVVGKFRLIRNGAEVPLGDGVFSNTATLYLYKDGVRKKIAGRVGDGGTFAWPLAAGNYEISHVGFGFQGQRHNAPTNLVFTVTEGREASYIGTIAMEVTMDTGYMGTLGSLDRFRISDECATDCSRLLSTTGLSSDDLGMSLAHWHYQTASRL